MKKHLVWSNRQNMAVLAALVIFTAGNAFINNSLTRLLMDKGLREDVSIFYGITGVIGIFSVVFSGRLIDPWGPRKVVIRFLPFWCMLTICFVWAEQLWVFIGVRLIHEFVHTAISSSIFVLFMESVSKNRHKEALFVSIAAEFIVISLGVQLGAWLLAEDYLVEWGCIPLVLGLVTLSIVYKQPDMLFHQAKAVVEKHSTIEQNWWSKTKTSIRSIDKNLLLLNCSLIAIPLTNTMYYRYLPLYMPGMWSAHLLTIHSIASASFGWLVIKITKRWNKFQVMKSVHVGYLVGLLFTWMFPHSVPLMVVAMILLGWSTSSFMLGFIQTQYDEAPQEEKGKQSSLNNLPAKIATPTGHWGSDIVVGRWSYTGVWWMLLPFHLFGMLVQHRLVRKTKK